MLTCVILLMKSHVYVEQQQSEELTLRNATADNSNVHIRSCRNGTKKIGHVSGV